MLLFFRSLVALLQRLLGVLVLTASASLTAAPSEPSAQLQTFLNDLQSYQADFAQEVFDEYGELLEESTGTLSLQRPNRFRWHYQTPYEQYIVSDGATLWTYDVDLEQVTVNALAPPEAGSPAQLLAGEVDVERLYQVSARADESGQRWLQLRARQSAGDFSLIEVALNDGALDAMRLTDNLGQVTAIRFTDERRNGTVDPADFVFEPPPGVDVVRGPQP